jgi:hypothetical protein
MPPGTGFDRGSMPRENGGAMRTIEQRRGHERDNREDDEQRERRGDCGQAEEIKSDVSAEERIGLANRNAVHRHEDGHPLRRCDECDDERHDQRADEEQSRNEVRDVHGDAVATIEIERGDSGRAVSGPADVSI